MDEDERAVAKAMMSMLTARRRFEGRVTDRSDHWQTETALLMINFWTPSQGLVTPATVLLSVHGALRAVCIQGRSDEQVNDTGDQYTSRLQCRAV